MLFRKLKKPSNEKPAHDEKASVNLGDLAKGHELLIEGIKSLFLNDKYSDITIKCGGHRCPCHTAIICPRSEFFATSCKPEWLEGKAGVIPLDDDEPLVIKEMLRYLYTGEYNTATFEESEGAALSPLLLHVHLHTVGDKYMMPDLCELAEEKFVATAGDKWNSEEFADAIAEMYATSPDTKTAMHKTAVAVAFKHAKQLYNEDVGIRFREVASTTPRFMSELFGTLVTLYDLAAEEETRYACTRCQGTFVIERMDPNSYYHCPHPPCAQNRHGGLPGAAIYRDLRYEEPW